MKFDCGETFQEKKDRLSGWHDYFAWLPVRVGSHDCRWLETIRRKGVYYSGVGVGGFWIWSYKPK